MSLSAAQKKLRETLVGSSEIGAIVDFYAEPGAARCDPFKTAQDVFNEKVLPPAASAAEKAHQRWGHFQEPGILGFHAEEHGLSLVAPADLDLESEPGSGKWRTLVHGKRPLCATPDGIGFTGRDGYRDIQAKNAQRWGSHRWGEAGSDDAPLVYVGQLQIELGILLQHEKFAGRIDDVGDLAVCLEGAPPTAYHIKFDPELFGGLATLAEKFTRDFILPKKPPKIDGSDSASEYVRRRWEKHVGALKPRSDRAVELADGIRAAKANIKGFEGVLEALANELKQLIGGAAGIEGLCTWKKAKDSAEVFTDWRAVAEDAALTHVLASTGYSPQALDLAASFLAPYLDKHTIAKITKKGSRRLLLLKANGTNEEEEEKKE